MCGIVGYIGYRNAGPLLIEGLKQLEYRGYDSYGIATLASSLNIFKHKGKISEDISGQNTILGSIGIGHTRWATHGVPNDCNAHPHTDCHGKIAIVHNGIITNFATLKNDLECRGHKFRSDTDSEVIAHLAEEYYHGDLLDAVKQTLPHLQGSYAILAIAEHDNTIVAARNKSPLVLGFADNEVLAASDITPLLDYTERVMFLNDGDIAALTPGGATVFQEGKPVERTIETITWQRDEVRKGGFSHYMLKEIYEQPMTFYETRRALNDEDILNIFQKPKFITILACGTSFHAGLIAQFLLEEICWKHVRVELASEFKYCTPPMRELAVAITQSGETADTNAALEKAKAYGCHSVALTNVQGSSITRLASSTLFMRAGPEMSVAATKSFIAQLAAIMQIVNVLCDHALDNVLNSAHRSLEQVLLGNYLEAVEMCKKAKDIFYIGRGPFYPVALEGALKMKEIAYIHAEAYAAGELKHGPFALLTSETPVIALCLSGITHDVMIANIKEVKARGAPVIGIGEERDQELANIVDVFIPLKDTNYLLQIITSTVILQLIAFYTAHALGCEIDRPRNLAKSVTVE